MLINPRCGVTAMLRFLNALQTSAKQNQIFVLSFLQSYVSVYAIRN